MSRRSNGPRPSTWCSNPECQARSRRSPDTIDQPCKHCGGVVVTERPSRQRRDYERHADLIGGSWTPERVDDLLRRNREDAIRGQV